MPRFCANLGFLFAERPFLDRFAAAAKAGFAGVEFASPYEHDAREIARRLAGRRLGSWARGGSPSCPDGLTRSATASRALDIAEALGCERLNCVAGIAPPDADRGTLEATFLDNLAHAAEAAARRKVKLLIEPINTREMPGFCLNCTDEALRLIERVRSDNLYLQADIYHMQVTEGDLARRLEAAAPGIAHIQIADNPGRREPSTGEINYAFLIPLIDRVGYDGQIGCEYRPTTTAEAGLGWMSAYRT